MNPPRFPTMLIMPMEAAAAEAASVVEGSTQNDGVHPHSMEPVRYSHTSVRIGPCPSIVESAKKTPASASGTAVWNRRSCLRSDDLPAYQTTPIAARKAGITRRFETELST